MRLRWRERIHHLDSFLPPNKQAMFVTWLGLAKNFTMTIGKAVIGVTSNSAALVADAAHSASDMVSDVVAVATLKVARMPGVDHS